MQKEKHKIIIDTNLWISFLLSNHYKKLDKLLKKEIVTLIFSNELLEEFLSVALRPKFKKYFSLLDLEALLDEIHSNAELIEVTSDVKMCRDKKDDFLLSLAQDSKADFLLTGDKDLLEIGKIGETKIMTMAEYFTFDLNIRGGDPLCP